MNGVSSLDTFHVSLSLLALHTKLLMYTCRKKDIKIHYLYIRPHFLTFILWKEEKVVGQKYIMLLILKRSWGRSSLSRPMPYTRDIVERHYVASPRLYIRAMTIHNRQSAGETIKKEMKERQPSSEAEKSQKKLISPKEANEIKREVENWKREISLCKHFSDQAASLKVFSLRRLNWFVNLLPSRYST